MIDLTPLDVRNKRGDFKRHMRGYDPEEVNVFLEIVAERLETLVRENLQLRERADNLSQQVSTQSGRERAVQEALVTAQELRADIRSQAEREAELTVSEARAEAKRITGEAEAKAKDRVRDIEGRLENGQDALEEVERRRLRFLKSFRQLLERELDVVEVEESKAAQQEAPIELDLGGGKPEDGGGLEAAILHATEEAFTAMPLTELADREGVEANPPYAEAAPEAENIESVGHAEGTTGEASASVEASDDSELFALPDFPTVPEEGDEDPRWG